MTSGRPKPHACGSHGGSAAGCGRHVAANIIKIMAMAKVNRESLHTDALDRTLERIYELLFSLIFKEDA